MQTTSPEEISDQAIDRTVDRLRRVIERQRRAREERFGWTRLEATIALRPAARTFTVEGEVFAAAMIEDLRVELLALIPPGWKLVLRLSPITAGPWRAPVQRATPLYRFFPSPSRPLTLTTELLPRDGRVQCLARKNGASLLRAVDGTTGWAFVSPGAVGGSPRFPRAHGSLARVARILRSYLGATYRLGGARHSGIDCSALVQRALRDGLNVLVPRHSADQFAALGTSNRRLGEPGDLIYTWSKDQPACCHVGIVIQGRHPPLRTVVHASSSRGRVVEDPLDDFLAQADRVAHADFAQLLDHSPCPVPA